MNDDDEYIRAFLTRWLLEFGTRAVGIERWQVEWYGTMTNDGRGASVNSGRGKDYFTAIICADPYSHKYQLNQAGLDFIKGEPHDERTD